MIRSDSFFGELLACLGFIAFVGACVFAYSLGDGFNAWLGGWQ